MSQLKRKDPAGPPYQGSYISGPTPIADWVERIFVGAIIGIMGPFVAAGLAIAVAWVLIDGIGGWTGLTAVWAELVARASAVPAGPTDIATLLVQNIVCGALVALVLAVPTIRRSLERFRLQEIARTLGTSTAAAGAQMSASAILLYMALGIFISLAMMVLGLLLPLPGIAQSAAQPDSVAFAFFTGTGGGWPPSVDSLSDFAIFALTAALLLGGLFGGLLWPLLAFASQRLMPVGTSEAVAGAGGALGVLLANALTGGRGADARYWTFRDAAWKGVGTGALSGFIYGVVVLFGAMVLGVG